MISSCSYLAQALFWIAVLAVAGCGVGMLGRGLGRRIIQWREQPWR